MKMPLRIPRSTTFTLLALSAFQIGLIIAQQSSIERAIKREALLVDTIIGWKKTAAYWRGESELFEETSRECLAAQIQKRL